MGGKESLLLLKQTHFLVVERSYFINYKYNLLLINKFRCKCTKLSIFCNSPGLLPLSFNKGGQQFIPSVIKYIYILMDYVITKYFNIIKCSMYSLWG